MSSQIDDAWELVLGRSPGDKEAEAARSIVEQHGLALLTRILFNSNEFIWID